MTQTPTPPAPVTDPEDGVALPRLGWAGWLRWAWRGLTSMRTALLLLLLLAVAAVPGSVLPQRRIDPGAVLTYLDDHRSLGPLLDRLGFFDVYTSPWFSAIYLLLFVSLVGCVLPRSRVHLRALRAAPPRTPRRLERMEAHRTATTDATPEEVLAAARAVLRRRRYRLAVHDDGASLAAERGHLAETGNLAFHLALLGLLAGVAAGSLTGYTGQALVVEGAGFANVVPQYASFEAGSRVDRGSLTPFALTLDRLDARFEGEAGGSQLGAPRRFDAHLRVQDEPGAPERRVTIRPNEPLDVGGVRAFLVGNGYAPVMTVRDGNGDVAFRGPVPSLPQDARYRSLTVLKVPDAAPRQIALAGVFTPTTLFDPVQGPISILPDPKLPRLSLTAYVSRPGEDGLGVDSGVPQSVFVLDERNLVQLRGDDGGPLRLLLAPGQTVTLPDGAGSVTFEALRRYAVLDVRYDPTKGWVLAAAVLALAGLTASLFVRRRRLWVRVSRDAQGRTVVEAAGLARGEDAGLGAEVDAVLASVPGGSAGDVPGGGAVPARAGQEAGGRQQQGEE